MASFAHAPIRPLLRILRWIGRHELSTLVTVCLAASSVWLFVAMADEISEYDTQQFDQRILLALRTPDDITDPLGPKYVEELGRDFTALGGVGVLVLISTSVVIYLLLSGKPQTAILLASAIVGALVTSLLLKYGFSRPRPELVPHESYVYTSSFPSGHAMSSAATYLSLGGLLARSHRRFRFKAFFLLLAIGLTLFVGISRVYLGVHWPTDVVAGWALGAFWATLVWLVAKWLQNRGHVEPETKPVPDERTSPQTT